MTFPVKDAKAKYPWLSRVIAGCLVGWDVDIPPIVYQSLMVKVAEAIEITFGVQRNDGINCISP